ncbi:hypothetical protein [Streptomyces sp. YIM S03343]
MTGPKVPTQRDVHSVPSEDTDADAEMAAVVDLLVRGLRALGSTGQVDLASRLAGHAWSVLRSNHARSADRLNGLLHYLARLPDTGTTSAPTPPHPPRSKS